MIEVGSLRYRRLDFKCVVKRLRMVLTSHIAILMVCELPSEQATPSALAKGVAYGEAAGWL